MDWIDIGKLFMVGLIFHMLPKLIFAKPNSFFDMEDWLGWRYWFIIPFHIGYIYSVFLGRCFR